MLFGKSCRSLVHGGQRETCYFECNYLWQHNICTLVSSPSSILCSLFLYLILVVLSLFLYTCTQFLSYPDVQMGGSVFFSKLRHLLLRRPKLKVPCFILYFLLVSTFNSKKKLSAPRTKSQQGLHQCFFSFAKSPWEITHTQLNIPLACPPRNNCMRQYWKFSGTHFS